MKQFYEARKLFKELKDVHSVIINEDIDYYIIGVPKAILTQFDFPYRDLRTTTWQEYIDINSCNVSSLGTAIGLNTPYGVLLGNEPFFEDTYVPFGFRTTDMVEVFVLEKMQECSTYDALMEEFKKIREDAHSDYQEMQESDYCSPSLVNKTVELISNFVIKLHEWVTKINDRPISEGTQKYIDYLRKTGKDLDTKPLYEFVFKDKDVLYLIHDNKKYYQEQHLLEFYKFPDKIWVLGTHDEELAALIHNSVDSGQLESYEKIVKA